MMKKFKTLSLVLLSILLLIAPYAYADSEYIEGEVLVVLRDNAVAPQADTFQKQSERTVGATDTLVRNAAEKAGAAPVKTYQALSRTGNGIVALLKSDSKTTDELISDLLENPDVVSVSPNRKIYAMATTPNDTEFDSLWGLNMINAPDAWDITSGDANIYVAVLDSGIDEKHLDLADNFDSKYSLDFTGEGNDVNDVNDGNGHGTHVSGITGAVGNNSIGVSGVNWRAKIIMLKVLDKNGYGKLSWTVCAIDYLMKLLLDYGLLIPAVNMSYGGYESVTPDKYVGSAEWIAFKKLDDTGKTVIVTAAGNDGFEVGVKAPYKVVGSDGKTQINEGDVVYPASMIGLNNMIVVGSLGPTKKASYFSNWSSKYVHVAAPGGDSKVSVPTILSTVPGGYGCMEGTSMAAPFVTGSIALLASSKSHENLNASQLKAHLLSTSSTDINPQSTVTTITHKKASDKKISKYGLIDIGEAVNTQYDSSVSVTGITLIAPQTSLTAGKSMYIAAEIEPQNASDKTLTWSSSDDSVAAVNSSGYVSALSEGSATITATSTPPSHIKGVKQINVTLKDESGSNGGGGGGGCDMGTFASLGLAGLLAVSLVKVISISRRKKR
jgi:subtilisin family serine protease